MENLSKLRDSLSIARLHEFVNFRTHHFGEWLNIDDLIEEIDNLSVCKCPPKDELS